MSSLIFTGVVKHHLVEFCNQFRFAIVSRKIFEWQKQTPPETLTDIQRAARFFYLQKLCFGGRATGRTFGMSTTGKPKLNLVRLEEEISETHARLAQVVIENLDWSACMERYDRPHTFFFIDPPYWQLAGYDAPDFSLYEFKRLAERLANLKGKAILTVNDHPDIRPIFAQFEFEQAEIQYSVGEGAVRARSTELIYRTYPAVTPIPQTFSFLEDPGSGRTGTPP